MKHIKTLNTQTLNNTVKKGGCGECQTSCPIIIKPFLFLFAIWELPAELGQRLLGKFLSWLDERTHFAGFGDVIVRLG